MAPKIFLLNKKQQQKTILREFTRVKTLNLFPVDENRLQQCCAAPHEQCCQQYVTTLLSITRCNNIVDNNVRGVQHNIVEACSHQPGTTCAF